MVDGGTRCGWDNHAGRYRGRRSVVCGRPDASIGRSIGHGHAARAGHCWAPGARGPQRDASLGVGEDPRGREGDEVREGRGDGAGGGFFCNPEATVTGGGSCADASGASAGAGPHCEGCAGMRGGLGESAPPRARQPGPGIAGGAMSPTIKLPATDGELRGINRHEAGL